MVMMLFLLFESFFERKGHIGIENRVSQNVYVRAGEAPDIFFRVCCGGAANIAPLVGVAKN